MGQVFDQCASMVEILLSVECEFGNLKDPKFLTAKGPYCEKEFSSLRIGTEDEKFLLYAN